MSSYSSNSSFLSDSNSSLSTSSDSSKGSHFPNHHQSPEFALAQADAVIVEEEALDHPLLQKYNKDVPVVDALGFPVMQTKSAWQKQMAEKAKEDLRKEKKAIRKAKHSHHGPEPVTLLSKKEKKAKKHEIGVVDEDA
ncbi:hypothetical protein RQP46_009442 [Phenoliferia psychrophenolica]